MTDSRNQMTVPWYPPMAIIAGCGLLFMSAQLTRQFIDPNEMIPIGAAHIVGGICMGYCVTARQMFEAIHLLQRLGIHGFSRPRSWFELSRLIWMLLMFLASFAVAVLICQGLLPQFADWFAWSSSLLLTCSVLGALFLCSSTMGYVMALINWRMPRGRGFECTHYFYILIVSFSLIGWAVSYYPPATYYPNGIILTVAGVAGIGMLTFGMMSIAHQYERREQKTSQ